MDRLPSNIMFDILSRLPVKCLVSARCVSKQWCEFIDDPHFGFIHGERFKEDPIPILFHQNHHRELPRTQCFHIMKSSEQTDDDLALKVTKALTDHPLRPLGQHRIINYVINDLGIKYVWQKPVSDDSFVGVQFKSSCNGLLLIAQHNAQHVTSLSAIHPRRKECYELPQFPSPLSYLHSRESCGLGFDDSSNTFKAVCVFLKKDFVPPDNRELVTKNLCTMVHVFGTNSWQEISQVPCLPVKDESVFAHGRLYWLVSFIDRQTDDEVIWFDVRKEEFGSICPPPKTVTGMVSDHLVDLNGEVGLVRRNYVTMEIWVLFKLDEWVMHCQFNIEDQISKSSPRVLGCWNKDGDVLIRCIPNGRYRFFVYNLKHGATYEVDVVGRQGKIETDIVMYPYSLLSIRGINTNSRSLRSKTDSKKTRRCRF